MWTGTRANRARPPVARRMPSVYDLKSRFQDLLRPVCNSLARRGVSANQVTVLAILLSLLYGAALCLDLDILWLCLPVVLFVRMGLNAIDGMLAREHDMKSRLGMALNEAGDVASDVALFVPFAVAKPQAAPAVAGFILAAVLTEFCGLLAFMISGERRYDGPMGKSDRAFVIGVLALGLGLGVPATAHLGWVFTALGVLCLWSCFNRLRSAIGGA